MSKKESLDSKKKLGTAQFKWMKVFYRGDIKPNYIPSEFADDVNDDIHDRYGVGVGESVEQDSVILDPGGMMMADKKYISFDVMGYNMEIKPEHISNMIYRMQRSRDRAGLKKVYTGYFCYMFSEQMYNKVMAKLISLEALGDLSYKDMYDKVAGNVIMKTPKKVKAFDA